MSPLLKLGWRPFSFDLPREMVTAHGAWSEQRGWLLRLEAPDGRLGWGEAGLAAMDGPPRPGLAGTGSSGEGSSARPPNRQGRAGRGVAGARLAAGAIDLAEQSGPWPPGLAALGTQASQEEIEACLPHLPGPLAFALGAALAELDGLVGSAEDPWRTAPPSAWLLPAGEVALEELRRLLAWDRPQTESLEIHPEDQHRNGDDREGHDRDGTDRQGMAGQDGLGGSVERGVRHAATLRAGPAEPADATPLISPPKIGRAHV